MPLKEFLKMSTNSETLTPTFPRILSPQTTLQPAAAAAVLGSSVKWDSDEGFRAARTNSTNQTMDLPIDMQFNDGHLLSVVVYSILFIISAMGNLSVMHKLLKIRMKARLNRVNLLLMHLAIADLFVTFLMMPLEIGWNITVSWQAGDFMCRLMSFFRIFGIFLSGFIVICISFDRYFAVLKPLTLPEANRRGRLMLYMAWIGSILCSLPQTYIFHLEQHPVFTWYEQCGTWNSFSTNGAELAYNFFGFSFMYGFPMVVIIFCYSSILLEIYKVNALRKNGEELRRSSMEALTRAKVRTLKMTLVIVLTFFACWTPYNVMSLWYWFEPESARKVDPRIQKCLFLFACTNSCANPLIYGLFHIRSHQRRKSELRFRQTLLANNCRLERMDRPPYGVRVRWRPRDCLCPATTGSSSENSKHLQDRFPNGGRGITTQNGRHQGNGNGNNRHYGGGRSTIVDNYESNRRTKTTTLIPLTSREFHRHVPANHQELVILGKGKQGKAENLLNNNRIQSTSFINGRIPNVSTQELSNFNSDNHLGRYNTARSKEMRDIHDSLQFDIDLPEAESSL